MEYISSADQKTLNARYQNTALVGVALGASAGLYLVIGRVISPPATTINDAQLKTLYYVLYSAAGVVSLAVVFLRRWLMGRLAAKTGVNAVLGGLGMASIIGAALGEIVSILGLVGYMVTGDAGYSWRLGVLGLALIMYSFPRRGEWARAVGNVAQEAQ